MMEETRGQVPMAMKAQSVHLLTVIYVYEDTGLSTTHDDNQRTDCIVIIMNLSSFHPHVTLNPEWCDEIKLSSGMQVPMAMKA